MPFVGVAALGYAVILVLAAFSGFSIMKPKLNIVLKIVAWAATIAQVIYLYFIGGINVEVFTCSCLAVLEMVAVDFMVGAIVIGKDEEGNISDHYNGVTLAIIGMAVLAIIGGVIISALISLANTMVSLLK